jgi:BirA family transcriptional regulator, biotin operon repressor / biotin---[acetyl-CoA-carboxylase] ligase
MRVRILHYERVESTMDLIHALAESGAEAGTMVVATEQLQGRGSRGRAWHSPPGGLWMSALFRPPRVAGLEVLSLRVGLAVAGALDACRASQVRLKWPNDLMLDGRKLGGILCEARWQGGTLGWVAVGVGLNVQNSVGPELRTSAVSLVEVTPGIRTEDVLEPVAKAIADLDLGPERLSPAELEQFAARSWLEGREIRQPLSGVVTGLDDDGALRVRTTEGSQVSLRHGSVELAGATNTR